MFSQLELCKPTNSLWKDFSQVEEEEDLGSIGILEDMEAQALDMILRPQEDQKSWLVWKVL